VLTMNSVKILHAVRSAITATAELLVSPLHLLHLIYILYTDVCLHTMKISMRNAGVLHVIDTDEQSPRNKQPL